MKNQTLSKIMKAAWTIFRKGGKSFSQALKLAWANAKETIRHYEVAIGGKGQGASKVAAFYTLDEANAFLSSNKRDSQWGNVRQWVKRDGCILVKMIG